MGRKRGRPSIGHKKTFTISDRDYKAFKEWCVQRGLKISEVVRGSILFMMKEGSISDLLADPEMRRLAVRILERQKEKKNLEKEKNIGDEKKNEI